MLSKPIFAIPIGLACFLSAAPAQADPSFAGGQTWGFEIGFGGGWAPDTDYTRRLDAFGYSPSGGGHYRMSFAVEKILLPYFSLLLQTNLLDNQVWYRPSGLGDDDKFDWNTWSLDVHARAFVPTRNGRFRAYVQFGVGPAFTGSHLYTRTSADSGRVRYRELKVSYNLAGLLGIEGMVAKHFGFFVQGGYFFAPSLENLLGDRHQSGGGVVMGGVTARFGKNQ
ncbi:MAG: hypothetical protein HKN10_18705 [Myxococcales bacterium]|nr:hypothetical protein [Myxococcales bacterium]